MCLGRGLWEDGEDGEVDGDDGEECGNDAHVCCLGAHDYLFVCIIITTTTMYTHAALTIHMQH